MNIAKVPHYEFLDLLQLGAEAVLARREISSLISARLRSLFSNSASRAGDWRPCAITVAKLLISSLSFSRSRCIRAEM
jgi:hypothetical protein